MSNIVDLKKKPLGLLKCERQPDETVKLTFNRPLTTEELDFFHQTSERTAFLMRGLDP